MKISNHLANKKAITRILAVMLILLLTFITELLFNWQAIKSGYDDIDLTSNLEVIEENDNEKYVAVYENPDGIYVNKVKITGAFEKLDGYAIQTTEVNAFGKESEQFYEDIINKDFNEFVTNINKKITYLKVTIPKPENAEVYSVKLSNSLEWNKYRMLFFGVIFLLFYLTFFEKWILDHTEWYAAAAILMLGITMIFIGQVGRNSWDEAFHFNKAFTIASGKNVEWTEAASEVLNKALPVCNTKAEFAQLRNYMNEKGNSVLYTEKQSDSGITYSSLAYIPMALMIRLGMLLHLSFSDLFMLGKLGNLLFYAFIMFWAIREAKYKKLFLTFIAILPTCVFLASSYTYDSVVFACVTLGCVLWSNEAFSEAATYNMPKVIIAIFCFSIGCLSKAVYIPVILLMILIPQLKNMKKRQAVLWCLGILLICGLVMITFVLPVISNTVSGNLSYGGDSRGGDTGTIRQLVSMLKHPLESIKLMVSSVFQLDNFRNLGTPAQDNFFFGNLMFLNFSQFGVLPDKWAVLLVPVFVLTLLYEDKTEKQVVQYQRWKRVLIILIGAVTVFLVWLALYLDFTPVGETYIAGVQARYYLPLLYLGAIAWMNKKIKLQIDHYVMTRITLVSVNIFWIAGVMGLALKNRLL